MHPETFSAFFQKATGHAPYRYQHELALCDQPPAVLEIPTGAGKTQALICAWLYRRRVLGTGPRRLVYALPMRTLVEQTERVAMEIRAGLGIEPQDLPVHLLMGGEAPTDWRHHPELDQILIGTIDMLLSRALNRGYGESRFAWPVSFGLLNSDCHWVLDEVQLMGPARATSAQLDGLRAALGTALPASTTWASATVDRDALLTIDRPELGPIAALAQEDRQGTLAQRLNAIKTLAREDVAGLGARELPGRIARAILERHQPSARSIVVLNTVALAQEVHDALRRASKGEPDPPRLVLLHSRYRPPEREQHASDALDPPEETRGTIIVSTQVIEAGVDISAQLLATETAPFSSVAQRLGRCNRAGEHETATVLWLDRGDFEGPAGERAALPYSPDDLRATARELRERVGRSLSPAVLEGIEVSEHRDEPLILRRRDLVDLFDTSPDISGLDVDVSPFIRDAEKRSVSVFFRDLAHDPPASIPAEAQPAPDRRELVDVPIGDLRGRDAWVFDHVDDRWVRRRGGQRPGDVVMLDAAAGGYSLATGWAPKQTGAVPSVPAAFERPRPEAIGSELDNVERAWVTLTDHLHDVRAEVAVILEALGDLTAPENAIPALDAAAALHDVGKAHAVFQRTLLSGATPDERTAHGATLLAKSARGGGRHERPHFRHELASALALMDGARGQLPDAPELATYLVAAHHGRVRLSIRPATDEQAPGGSPTGARFALGIVDGDELPSVETPIGQIPPTRLDLSCMELGDDRSWTRTGAALRDDPSLGAFRLAFLEAILRVADWRASA